MRILVLDASYTQKVALIVNGVVVEKIENNSPKADLFMSLVDSVLKNANFGIDDIDKICVNVGPGSFTGIRVAVAIAKGLGATKKICYSQFNSFDYFEENENIILSGFSNFVYIKKNDNEMDCVDISLLDKSVVYNVCDERLKNRLAEIGVKSNLRNLLDFDKIENIMNGEIISISEIRPLYLRASQAEIQRESRLGGKV